MRRPPNLYLYSNIAALLFGLNGATFAQEASNLEVVEQKTVESEKPQEEIIVRGVRNSILDALNRKRNSDEIMDSISAEDIGQFSDTSVAESMQRITGIQLSRDVDTGEGTGIQIRGLSDNNVTINGEIVAGVGEGRDINFQDIPSEMFSSIVVNKVATADKIEGSSGGSVELVKRRPLGFKDDTTTSVNLKGVYAENIEEVDPDAFIMVNQKFGNTPIGKFGVLLSGSYKEVNARTEATNAVWQRLNSAGTGRFISGTPNYQIDVNGDGVTDIRDTYFAPNRFQARVSETYSERTSLGGTFQWQPQGGTNILFDVNYTSNDTDNRTDLLNTIFTDRAHTGVDDPANYDLINGVLQRGTFENIDARFGGAPSVANTEVDTLTWQFAADHKVDNWKFEAGISSSKSERSRLRNQVNVGYDWNNDGAFAVNDRLISVDWDFTGRSKLPDLTFYDPNGDVLDFNDMTNPNLRIFQVQRNLENRENTSDSFKFDISRDFDEGFITQVKFGYRWHERGFENQSYQSKLQNRYENAGGVINPLAARVPIDHPSAMACIRPSNYGDILTDHSGDFPRQWGRSICTNSQIEALWQLFPIDSFYQETDSDHDPSNANHVLRLGTPRYEQIAQNYEVTEEANAFYLRLDFEQELANNMIFFGNIGGRYVETDTESSGFSVLANRADASLCRQLNDLEEVNGVLTPAEEQARDDACTIVDREYTPLKFKGNYYNFLPSANLNLQLNENMYIRLGAAKTINRPNLTDLRPNFSINFDNEIINRGNPQLLPRESENWDLSYEWYFTEESLLSVAVFGKDVKNAIRTESTPDVPFAESEGGDGLLYTLRTKENDSGVSEIEGYELTLQHSFRNLPWHLKYTGINMNYTHVEETGFSRENLHVDGSVLGRQNLSEDSYNIVLFYDNDKFSARLAYNWRDTAIKGYLNVTDKYTQCDKDGDGVLENNEWNCHIGRFDLNDPFNPFAYDNEGQARRLPNIEEDRGQLDFSMAYKFSDQLRVSLQGTNLNESTANRYLDTKDKPLRLSSASARYTLAVSYKF